MAKYPTNNQNRSLWQRFWQSPWTWFVFGVYYLWEWSSIVSTDWVRWLYFTLAIVCAINAFTRANERWGTP